MFMQQQLSAGRRDQGAPKAHAALSCRGVGSSFVPREGVPIGTPSTRSVDLFLGLVEGLCVRLPDLATALRPTFACVPITVLSSCNKISGSALTPAQECVVAVAAMEGRYHSITSSARAISIGGIVSLSALALFTFSLNITPLFVTNSHGIAVAKSILLVTASWRRLMAQRARSAADGQLWTRSGNLAFTFVRVSTLESVRSSAKNLVALRCMSGPELGLSLHPTKCWYQGRSVTLWPDRASDLRSVGPTA